MGCNCGKKKKAFKEAVKPKIVEKPTNILETPDNLLTPRQIRAKNRRLRIQARNARIQARNEMAEKLRLASNNTSTIITQNP